MERHVERLLNRVSAASIVIATIILVLLILQTPETCVPPEAPLKPHTRFPRSTCDASPRQHVPLHKKNSRLWSSKRWRSQVSSYASFFHQIRDMDLLHNHSRALCLYAGAGHEAMALNSMGVEDVTAVEVVESPPLVSKADPHNLPFFDSAFDFAFTAHLDRDLFPDKLAAEMERTVRSGGVCVIAVDECGEDEVRDIAALFTNCEILSSANMTLIGSRVTRLIMRVRSSQ